MKRRLSAAPPDQAGLLHHRRAPDAGQWDDLPLDARPTAGERSREVQLGPGQKNYLPGWVNVDANIFTGKCDVWTDLRNPLPFRDATVNAFYSHHVIEHLPDLAFHFSEMYRCLKPGGSFRVGGPNGDAAMRKFLEGDASCFIDSRTGARIGGRFENFIFCRQEHLTILTYSWLEELAIAAGFEAIPGLPARRGDEHPDRFDAGVLGKEPGPPRTARTR